MSQLTVFVLVLLSLSL